MDTPIPGYRWLECAEILQRYWPRKETNLNWKYIQEMSQVFENGNSRLYLFKSLLKSREGKGRSIIVEL